MSPVPPRRVRLRAAVRACVALAGMASLSAGAALAQDVDVTVGGLSGTAGSPLATLLRLVAALVVVLLAFWGCARLMRRLNGVGGGPHGGLRIVGALSLGHRERLVVVQAGEEQLLLGVSAGRIERLHLLERPLAPSTAAIAAATAAPGVAPGAGTPDAGMPVAATSGAGTLVAGDGQDFRARLLAAMQRQVRP